MSGDTHPGQVLARLPEPRGEPTRIAIVADPHVATEATGTSKLLDKTLQHFTAAIDDIRGREFDLVLSPGDLTKDGEPWNYRAVDSVLAELNCPFYAVPGNHDVPKAGDEHETPSVQRFVSKYTPGTLPYKLSTEGVDIVGVNTAGTTDRLLESHNGRVTRDTREWLTNALDPERPTIVLAHHNFPPISDQIAAHQSIDPEMHLPPVMEDPQPFADVLANGDVELVITGHYHLPATATYRGVREIAAPTTCSFPQAYLSCTVEPTGTTIRQIPVADTHGLEYGHHERTTDSPTSAGLTAIAAARLASFPLVGPSEQSSGQ